MVPEGHCRHNGTEKDLCGHESSLAVSQAALFGFRERSNSDCTLTPNGIMVKEKVVESVNGWLSLPEELMGKVRRAARHGNC